MEDEFDVTNYRTSQRGPDLFVLKANSAGKSTGKQCAGSEATPFSLSLNFPLQSTARVSIEPLISHVLKFSLSEGHSLFLL